MVVAHALLALVVSACAVTEGGAGGDASSPPSSPSATQPAVCDDPRVRPICTELTVVARNHFEPTFETIRPGELSLDPSGRLRYSVTVRADGTVPAAVKDRWEFLFTDAESWRRFPAPEPYDLRFVGRGQDVDLQTDYEVLIELSTPAGPRAVDAVAIMRTILDVREIR